MVGVEAGVGVPEGVGVGDPGVGVLVKVGVLVGVQPPTSVVTALERRPAVSASVSQAWLVMMLQPLSTTAVKVRVPVPPAGI